jgi:hypothetical protein
MDDHKSFCQAKSIELLIHILEHGCSSNVLIVIS